MAFTINHAQIMRKITTPNKRVEALARFQVEQRFENEKTQLITDIENDPISQELNSSGGEDGSSFLGGRSGNLRAFIGFYDEDDPVGDLISLINAGTKMAPVPPRVLVHGSTILYRFRAQTPTLKELYEQTKYPDEWSGGSWLKGIENGVSGLRYYLFSTNPKILKSFKNSRSGYAIQSKQIVKSRPSSMNGQPYISKLLEDFRQRVSH